MNDIVKKLDSNELPQKRPNWEETFESTDSNNSRKKQELAEADTNTCKKHFLHT